MNSLCQLLMDDEDMEEIAEMEEMAAAYVANSNAAAVAVVLQSSQPAKEARPFQSRASAPRGGTKTNTSAWWIMIQDPNARDPTTIVGRRFRARFATATVVTDLIEKQGHAAALLSKVTLTSKGGRP